MSSITREQMFGSVLEDIKQFRKSWSLFLVFGVLQIVVGLLAVSFAFSSTMASVAVLGTLLVVAAGAEFAAAIMARGWRSFFLFVLLGILYGCAGFLTLAHPVAAAESLTLLLAIMFLVGGLFRMVVALMAPFPYWGWVLINGIIALFLGIAIFTQWPASGLWVLGTFVGIDLILNGITWSILAIGVRNDLRHLAITN
ncbi:MAG TPA: HdeD family acid-resistance protein [Planctomycetaceae bacterium]|nr:HdeD family acid-resistance protein [Planctomycetaceae bacterium]